MPFWWAASDRTSKSATVKLGLPIVSVKISLVFSSISCRISSIEASSRTKRASMPRPDSKLEPDLERPQALLLRQKRKLQQRFHLLGLQYVAQRHAQWAIFPKFDCKHKHPP